MSLITSALILLVLVRFGLLATAFYAFAGFLLSNFPLTLDASAWYSGYGFAALLIFAAVVLYAFRNSLGGRPLLGAPPLDK